MFAKFNTKHCTLLVHSRAKFKLDTFMFTPIRPLLVIFPKNQNFIKSDPFGRFRPNSIPKVLNSIVFICIFRTIAKNLRKLKQPQTFFKNFKIA